MMFTGLFRRRESELSAPENLKQRQIESLRKLNPTLIEIQKNEEYRLNVASSAGIVTLSIYLSPYFPQEKPVVTVVSPPVRHPWVKEHQQIICCPELLNFSMHSDLGKVVLGISDEFQRNPPIALLGTSPPRNVPARQYMPFPASLNNGLTSHSSAVGFPNAVYKPGSGKSVLHLPFPQVSSFTYDPNLLPTSFPELKDLSLKELKELNTNDDKIQEYIDKLEIMNKMTKEKEKLNQLNEELAAENLAKKPLLEDNKRKLLEMIDTVNNLRQQFDDYNHQYQSLAEQYSPTAIQENLKFAALQAEEDSEAIAENFLEGKLDIEEFLAKFTEKRILSHCRRSKEEKLHQQLMELKKSGF